MARQRGRGPNDRAPIGQKKVAPPIGQSIARAIATILLATALAGCFSANREDLVPTTVGVVTEVERLAGRSVAYHLASGEVAEVDLASADLTPDGGAGEGMLLLTGTRGSGRTWLIALYPNTAADVPPGCFQLLATGVGNGDSIDFSNGLRLSKAPNFDPGPAANDQYNLERVTFCIGERGEVLSYG